MDKCYRIYIVLVINSILIPNTMCKFQIAPIKFHGAFFLIISPFFRSNRFTTVNIMAQMLI